MKNNGFTLAEVLIALSLLGMISVVMIRNISLDAGGQNSYNSRTNIMKIFKVIDMFDNASSQLRDDQQLCPTASFLYPSGKNAQGADEYEIGLLTDAATPAQVTTSAQVFSAYSRYIKFESTGIDFCSNTGYSCSNIPGGKLPGGMYAGIEKLSSITNCPDFYLPQDDGTIAQVTVRNELGKSTKPQCWAKLYIDINGTEGPNTEGSDVFIYGIDKVGIYH